MAEESLAEPVRCLVPTDNQLLMMNHSAEVWFAQQRCGGGSQLHLTARGCEWWFLVRHGERMSRFIAVNHDGTRSVHCFRPERFDLIVYNTSTQELRINAESAGRRDFCRRTVGSVLFGRTNHFPNENKYSLSPIIARRRDALVCTDVPGIFRVHLDALRFVFADDPESRVITYSNGDVLSLVESGRIPLPDDAHLLQATFKMQFADRRTPLSVTIKPPNVAQYVRGAESAIVEQWLNRRQFIRSERNQGYGQTEYHLALH